MARKSDQIKIQQLLQTVQNHNGQIRAAGLAKILGWPRQAIMRLLPQVDSGKEKYLCEDDQGFLSIFKRKN